METETMAQAVAAQKHDTQSIKYSVFTWLQIPHCQTNTQRTLSTRENSRKLQSGTSMYNTYMHIMITTLTYFITYADKFF